PEVREEIIALSKQYGIVTPLTAGLITEDTVHAGAPRQDATFKNRQRTAGPAGPPAAPAFNSYSGQNAVAASKATGELRRADQIKTSADLRVIEGKTFEL